MGYLADVGLDMKELGENGVYVNGMLVPFFEIYGVYTLLVLIAN
jgi:hypothetical protein